MNRSYMLCRHCGLCSLRNRKINIFQRGGGNVFNTLKNPILLQSVSVSTLLLPIVSGTRENEGTERDIEGIGWDMSIPLKLLLVSDGNRSLFPQTLFPQMSA